MREFLKGIVFLIMTILFFINCNKDGHSLKTVSKTVFVEDFDSFYDQFHSDSLFQMARIKFPLKGHNVDGFEKINWTKENWNMLRTKIYDIDKTQFKTNFKKNKTTFIQKCTVLDSGFSSELRFELIDKKWFLVYALEKNL
jgi:hypothetical protein